MKALLCSDIHNHKESLVLLKQKSKGVDFVICAGDMSIWGSNLNKVLFEMNSWGKKVFVIHGNHEALDETKRICESLENLIFFNGEVAEFQSLKLIGWGGGGFSLQDRGFERFVEGLEIKDFSRSILVTHAPPFETCLDETQPGVFVGNESIKQFIVKNKPLIAVSGHIHETAGMVCNLNDVVLINPGPEGVVVEL